MKKGTIYVLGCYLLWGSLPVFWKQLSMLDAMYVLANRIIWAMVFGGVLLLCRGDRFAGVRATFRDRRELTRLILSGVFICINWGMYIWSVNNGHMIDASLAYYMNPILAIVLGMLVFRETLTPMQVLAVAVTFAGLVITVFRYNQFPWIALIIGGSFAVYGALKKTVRSDGVTSTFVESLVLSPFFLVLIAVMESRGTGAAGTLEGWRWALLPMAGVVTMVPLMLFSVGMKTTSMSLSGILMYLNPTLQLLISVWLYHEEFTATHGILFCFVWSGLILYLIAGYRKERKRQEELSCE